MADAFGSIMPAPVSDFFVFDFTQQIGPMGGTITSVAWIVSVDPSSPVGDPDTADRILEPPTFSSNKTSALLGEMIDGAMYVIRADVTLSDSRVLTDSATLYCTSAEIADPYLTIGQFRATMPAFSDTVRFPDTEVQWWINQACSPPNISYALNPYRWGQFFELGLNLWVAHNLAVADMMVQRAGPPGGPGSSRYGHAALIGSGIASSRSVGGVSVSYDNSLGIEQNAGWWGLTPWGSQFLYYLRLAGAAPVHLLGPPVRAGNAYYFGPYTGPYIAPY